MSFLTTLAATATGGLIAGALGLVPLVVRHRYRGRQALRVLRDDFYSDQDKLAKTILTREWWPNLNEITDLAGVEDVGVVAGRLRGRAWMTVSGARRAVKRMEIARRSDGPVVDQLPRLIHAYERLDNARAQLAKTDRTFAFKTHDQWDEVMSVGGSFDDLRPPDS